MPPPKGPVDKTGRYEHPHKRDRSRTPPRNKERARSRTPPRSRGGNADKDWGEPRREHSRNNGHRRSRSPSVHSVGRYSVHAPTDEKDDLYFGPKCFTDCIHKVTLHFGFAKVGPTYQKYTGSTNSDTWLSDYHTAVQINKGTDLEAVKFLPLMLLEGARDWIN